LYDKKGDTDTLQDMVAGAPGIDAILDTLDTTGEGEMHWLAMEYDKVLVMYAGRTMEYGKARDVFYQPVHPYSIGLLNAVPRLDSE
ncbi:hypothetical protein ONJ23_26120, partial [Salmonella enterica subsp. enterica serovar Virginia]|nr:hypothetical protein [Salmonella enterica subsp. enterica serovar Virginia]